MNKPLCLIDAFGAAGGVGRCTREILKQLQIAEVPVSLAGRSHVVDSFKTHAQGMGHLRFCNLEKPKMTFASLEIKFLSRYASRSSRLSNCLIRRANQRRLGGNGSPARPILINYPQVMAPPTCYDQFVVFIHDLNWRHYPGNFHDSKQTDLWCRDWVRKAERVIANSEFTRNELIQEYECMPEKVLAAPLAPFTDDSNVDERSGHEILSRYGLIAGRFYLYPGVWGLHKNHEVLTLAIEQSEANDPVVVTCGNPLSGIQNSPPGVARMRHSLTGRWEKLLAEKRIVVLENISGTEIEVLRRKCKAYVLPSGYEGFGFPLAEAIYHHRPAIVSEIPAHREILNRYPQYQLATLFPPNSTDALAKQLSARELDSRQSPVGWRESISATWSWANTVERIISALQC